MASTPHEPTGPPPPEAKKPIEVSVEKSGAPPVPKDVLNKALYNTTRFQTRSPCTCLAICVFTIMGLSMMAFAPKFGMRGMSPQTNYDFFINSSPFVEQFDKLTIAQDGADEIATADIQERSVASAFTSLTMLYNEQEDKDIFTPANIKAMCLAEKEFVTDDEYTKFCLLDPADNYVSCKAQGMSIPQMFYQDNSALTDYVDNDSFNSGACDAAMTLYAPYPGKETVSQPPIDYACGDLTQATVDRIKNCIITKATTGSELEKMMYNFYVGKDLTESGSTKSYTKATRSYLQLGLPLEGFDTIPCDLCTTDEQFVPVQKFYKDMAKKFFKHFDMKKGFMKTEYASQPTLPDGAEVYWVNFPLLNAEIEGLLVSDMTFVIFSIAFVVIYMNIHLGSCFIALISVWQICMSLTVAIFFYYVLFGIKFYAVLQGLTIFLVLGIGADDVFVIVDAWKQSKYDFFKAEGTDHQDYLHSRLLFAAHRAMEAVFNTTFTTSVAFVGTAISPIMPISTFGIYAAIAIILNYFFVLTVTPACIIINENWGGFEAGWGANWYRACKASIVKTLPFCKACAKIGCQCGMKEDHEVDLSKRPEAPVSAFYSAFYLPAMKNKVVASISVLLCTALGGFGVWGTLDLQTPSGSEAFLPDSHPIQAAQNSMQNDYGGAAELDYAPISYYWGLKDLDRKKGEDGGFNKFIPDQNRGSVTYDSDFDLYDKKTQQEILKSCDLTTGTIPNYACDLERGCYAGKLIRVDSTICFMEELIQWYDDGCPVPDSSPSGGVVCTASSTMKNREDNPSDEAEFMTNLKTFRTNTSPKNFPSSTWQAIIGIVGGELKFVTVPARLNLQQFAESSTTQKAVSEKCDELLKEIHDGQPDILHDYSAFEFTWLATSMQLQTSLYLGLGIAAGFALLVLTFATKNIIVSLLAITSIGGIIVSLLGFGQVVLGWELGIVESVAAIIVVGFSVDYTIHLGHMYNHAGTDGIDDRAGRFEYAIRKMGGTVMGGAITTGGSGAFMMMATMVFFYRMSWMITLTIILSLLWSLFFFMPVLRLCGPQGTTGHIFCGRGRK